MNTVPKSVRWKDIIVSDSKWFSVNEHSAFESLSFALELEFCYYNVTYTKDGYLSESLTNQSLYTNTTLPSLTLL